MKIALAQLNYHTGNFDSNTQKIYDGIENAKQQGADLVVFAELSICGYPPRDFLEFNDFVNQCEKSVEKVAEKCDGIAAIVGSPTRNKNPEGKHLFNSAYFLSNKKVQAITHKSLLPTYDIFDEYRYFQQGKVFEVIPYLDKRIALTICEDLWNVGGNKLYTKSPMDVLIEQDPDLIINISASPFSSFYPEIRKNVMNINSVTYNLPLFYVNHIGAQTELIFDGGSFVLNSQGEVVDELAYFAEDLKVYNLEDVIKAGPGPKDTSDITRSTFVEADFSKADHGFIHDALVLGIKDYFQKLGFKKAILGLSGGIDSAVTLVLAVKALGSENVHALLMPSRFSSDHSLTDAEKLASNLGVKYDTIEINDATDSFERTLEPHFKELPSNITEENIQARTRGVFLMAMANKFGYILLNTSNKSEIAVGYGTLYGDMCGGISVLGDIYKTQVYLLAEHINANEKVIPQNSIDKAPSAELRPEQKDSDSLPEYDILDKILFQYIENRKGPREIIDMGFDEPLVKQILKLVNTNEYKRQQTPPILRVSGKAFGMGRRIPIVAKYLS